MAGSMIDMSAVLLSAAAHAQSPEDDAATTFDAFPIGQSGAQMRE